MSESNSPNPWIARSLVLLPLGLVIASGIALWNYFYQEEKQALIEEQRFVQAVSPERIEDDLKKFITIIGERNTSSETARANLSRTASMIEGLLGPGNTGYRVKRTPGPAGAPILQISIQGEKIDDPAVWIVTSYDSRVGSRGAEKNATGLAATLAAAQALANDKPKSPIHFLFLPHVHDTESSVAKTAAKCSEIIREKAAPKAILCIESMGAGDQLWLSSRDTNALQPHLIEGLGKIYSAEAIRLGQSKDLASILFETSLPAARISTRSILLDTEPDDSLPTTEKVAASTGRLIELIRRYAKSS